MQRICSWATRLLTTIPRMKLENAAASFSVFQNVPPAKKLLATELPLVNTVCNFKVKGRVRRRCKSCYFVTRNERLYIICPAHPRHKQMAMKAKPLNTWVLTHASQSKVRPW